MKTKAIMLCLCLGCHAALAAPAAAQDETSTALNQPVFDDKLMIEGWAKKFAGLDKLILIEMIKDDSLSSYKMAAAVRVFSKEYGQEVVSREKQLIEKHLLRRLGRTDSAFVEVEVMCTLCTMDRYQYFRSMVPALIQKHSHYNSTVNTLAYDCLARLAGNGKMRAREARVVFNTLRKTLFLTRKRLEKTKIPDENLSQKLEMLRNTIKVLGTEELQKLPKEVMHLM